MSHFKIATVQRDFLPARRLVILQTDDFGKENIAAPLRFTPLDENQIIEQPTIDRGVDQFLQACLNHAWEIGMRPAGFLDTTRETAALNAHLRDMRALVFKKKLEPKP